MPLWHYISDCIHTYPCSALSYLHRISSERRLMNGSAQHKHTPQQITQFLKGLYSTAARMYRKSLYYVYSYLKQTRDITAKHFLQLMASTLVCALLLASTYQPGIAQEQSGSTDTQLPSELSQTEL